MTLREFLTAVRSRWRIVVAVVVVVVVAAGVVSLLRPSVYTSHVLIYVSSQTGDNANTAYQGGLLSEQRVASYVELVDRPSVAAEIARRLDPPGDPAVIADEISAETSAESILIDVSVTDPSPERATAIANAFGTVFPELVARIESPRTRVGQPPVAVSPVEPATVPTAPSSLGLPLTLALALLAGLVLGTVAAVLRHTLDTTITTRARLEEVASAGALATLVEDGSVAEHPVIAVARPRAALAEAFRTLRTNLRYLQLGKTSPVFMVTSSQPGEGKTLTSCNVAAALAAGGERVLLVEADLRDPKTADYLGIEGQVGLTTVLTGRLDPEQAVQSWGREHGTRLDVLTSGPLPPNPSELLGSEPMQRLVGWMRERYDVVIVDTPPALPVTDAAALAPLTDGALLVCRYGVTTDAQVRASVAAVEAVSVKVLGTVLSRVPRSRTGGYGYGYGYGTAGYGLRRTEPRPTPATDQDRTPAPAPRPAARTEAPTTGMVLLETGANGRRGDADA